MATADQLLNKLTKLRVDRARGNPAPHKPLLLLTIIEMAERGDLPRSPLPLTPELAFRFFTYYSVVAKRRKQKPDVRLPFHHMQSDGFWTALADDGAPSLQSRLTRFAELTSDFTACLQVPLWRDKARRILIGTYFLPTEQVSLFELIGMPIPSVTDLDREIESVERLDAEKKGREARFRISVVAAYNFTCALSGYRLTTISAGSIVDAAHIHQFANSRNNDTRNGIALCKNAHWLFDQGLWSLSDEYRIIVASSNYSEDSPDQKALRQYHGEMIRLPRDRSVWPNPIHLAWHRKHKFQVH